MKKLLSIIILFLLTISLVGCNSPTDLEDKVIELENRLEVLEVKLDGLVGTTGLNNQVDYYKNDPKETMIQMGNYELAKSEKEYIDVSQTPDYIWDENGDYIDIEELNGLLCLKYLDMYCDSNTGFQYKIQAFKPVDMSDEEYIVRLSMMIVELSLYDDYLIDSPQLYIEFIPGGSQYLTSRMKLLIDDKYDIQPQIFWYGLLDVKLYNTVFSTVELETIYQEFIDAGTFDGYVLPNYR